MPIKEFMRPDDFATDWYGYLTNQCGHMVLGVAMVAAWCAVGVFLWREFPDKWVMFGTLLVLFFSFQVWQGGTWADCIEDTVFTVCYGSGFALIALDWVDGWEFKGDLSKLNPWVWICVANLVIGCTTRHIAARRK